MTARTAASTTTVRRFVDVEDLICPGCGEYVVGEAPAFGPVHDDAPAALRRYLSLYEASLGDAPPDGDTPRARIQQQVDRLRQAVMAGAWDEGDAGCTGSGSMDVDAGESA